MCFSFKSTLQMSSSGFVKIKGRIEMFFLFPRKYRYSPVMEHVDKMRDLAKVCTGSSMVLFVKR